MPGTIERAGLEEAIAAFLANGYSERTCRLAEHAQCDDPFMSFFFSANSGEGVVTRHYCSHPAGHEDIPVRGAVVMHQCKCGAVSDSGRVPR